MADTPIFTAQQLNELRHRVLQVERGELPADAVTPEELRAAIEYFRTINKTTPPPSSKRAAGISVDMSDIDL